jgi:hypothetical protein
MTKGSNTISARKMRRLMERQQKKGKISLEEKEKVEKDLDNRKRAYEKNIKEYEETKENLINQVEEVKNIEIPISTTDATKYSIFAMFAQTLLMIAIFLIGSTYSITYLFGFIICLIEIAKTAIMKRYSISYNKVEEIAPSVESQSQYRFEECGTRLIIIDQVLSVFTYLSFSMLLYSDMGIIRSLMFLVLSLYRLYRYRDSCYQDNHYVKDLTTTIVLLIYYFVLYFDFYRIIFFVAMMYMYKDVREMIQNELKININGVTSSIQDSINR